MNPHPRTLVAIATYNEIDNLPPLVDAIFDQAPHVDVLVVDDHSPDGTGRWCDERAAQDSRLRVIHRPGKLGLGTATLAAMRDAIDHDYDLLLTLDADFSHHPRYIPGLLRGMDASGAGTVDVLIGSRYVQGGGVRGWPLRRRLMSRLVNGYARCMLGLSPKDCSGAFRCFRVGALKQIDLDAVRSRGYAFFEEILWHLQRNGAQLAETPIVFVDRQQGRSKINVREAASALWSIFRLGLINRFPRRG
jgi:dolichol-phosphate mannosyltransferase